MNGFSVVASSPEKEAEIRRSVEYQNAEWSRLTRRFDHLKKQYARHFENKHEMRDNVLYALDEIREGLTARWKAARTGTERTDVLQRGWRAVEKFESTIALGVGIGTVVKWTAIIGGGALLLYLLTRKTND